MFSIIGQQIKDCSNNLALVQLCESLQVARASFYRDFEAMPDTDEMKLRDAIQRIALSWSSYGYRRITAQLKREGFCVNHKRVLRLMREDNLLCLRHKRGFIATTDSHHSFTVYPNLASELELSDINQLWVADITYIRLQSEFIFLAVVMDAYSRRVVGWAISKNIDTELTLAALRMALSGRKSLLGLVHHSDRGVQYAASDYINELQANEIKISMSRRANPYDNAQCERFMRTLKYEEVYLSEYENITEAKSSIGHFIEKVYNRKRLHSALGYMPPAEFERSLYQTIYP